MKKLAILAVTALVMVACCDCKRTRKDTRPFVGTTWGLIQLGGTEISAEGKYQVTFSEDGKMSGIGFCNRLVGSYTDGAKQGQISVAPVASTMMMCLEANVEAEFFKSFEGVTSYSIDGDKLYLFTNGELRAIFEAQP